MMTTTMRLITLCLLNCLLISTYLSASPQSSGEWFLMDTPQGRIEVRQLGNAQNYWLEDREGNKITLNERQQLPLFSAPATNPRRGITPINQFGDTPVLVFQVEFNDIASELSTTDLNSLIFGASESVASFYRESLSNQVRLIPATESQGTNDGIIKVKLNETHPNTGRRTVETWVDKALQQANAYIDYSHFDRNKDGQLETNELALIFVFAGYEHAIIGQAPNVWAHANAGREGISLDGVQVGKYLVVGERHGSSVQYNPMTIGIICHELGHLLFNLPDLYVQNGGGSQNSGFGAWGLMGTGDKARVSGEPKGKNPIDFSGWSKSQIGLFSPRVLETSHEQTELAIQQSNDTAMVWADPYKHLQYFLLEYRDTTGLDSALDDSGLLISYVDQGHFSLNSAGKRLIRAETTDNQKLFGPNAPTYTSRNSFINKQLSQGTADLFYSAEGVIKDNVRNQLSFLSQFSTSHKSSYGYNERPWEPSPKSTSHTVIMSIQSGLSDVAEGVDIGVVLPGQFEIGLADSLTKAQSGNYILSTTVEPEDQAWFRAFFDVRTPLEANKEYFIVVKPMTTAQLMIDSGPANGKFYENGSKSDQDFSVRLLVETSPDDNRAPTAFKTALTLSPNTPLDLNVSTLSISDLDNDRVKLTVIDAAGLDVSQTTSGVIINAKSQLEEDIKIRLQLDDGYNQVEQDIILTGNANDQPYQNAGYKLFEEKSGGSTNLIYLLLMFILIRSQRLSSRISPTKCR